MVLALYNGCVILLIGIIVYMEIYLVVTGHSQVMLCTECQQCVSACPFHAKGLNPMAIMLAAKSGRLNEKAESFSACVGCGKCRKACPRGLSPYREIENGRAGDEAGHKEAS